MKDSDYITLVKKILKVHKRISNVDFVTKFDKFNNNGVTTIEYNHFMFKPMLEVANGLLEIYRIVNQIKNDFQHDVEFEQFPVLISRIVNKYKKMRIGDLVESIYQDADIVRKAYVFGDKRCKTVGILLKQEEINSKRGLFTRVLGNKVMKPAVGVMLMMALFTGNADALGGQKYYTADGELKVYHQYDDNRGVIENEDGTLTEVSTRSDNLYNTENCDTEVERPNDRNNPIFNSYDSNNNSKESNVVYYLDNYFKAPLDKKAEGYKEAYEKFKKGKLTGEKRIISTFLFDYSSLVLMDKGKLFNIELGQELLERLADQNPTFPNLSGEIEKVKRAVGSKHYDNYFAYGKGAMEQNRYEDAKYLFGKAIEMGKVQGAKKDTLKEYSDWLSKAKNIGSRDARWYIDRANAENNRAKRIPILEEARKYFPKSEGILTTLSAQYYHVGQLEKQLEILNILNTSFGNYEKQINRVQSLINSK